MMAADDAKKGTLESLRCHLNPLAVAAYASSGIGNLHPTCSCYRPSVTFSHESTMQECLSKTIDDVAGRAV